ncbi:MAG: alpha/beta hydrolase [Pseudobutyrivibrio sp.]|nr:alpha/beta hydrolase [Pseudobutyrivibrio sp.]
MSLKDSDSMMIEFRKQVNEQRNVMGESNSFVNAKKIEKKQLEKGIILYTDLQYESIYPNAFFDIWYVDDSKQKRPTLIFFHGGGFLFGDKMEGDPLAEGEPTDCTVVKEFIKHGYNVVSANYAFAPEYRFPTQIIQANELLLYLKKTEKDYGIYMDDIVIMGSSAGADIAEIYGLVLSNKEYAKSLSIEPAVDKSAIRGLVIDEAALDVKRMTSWVKPMTECWLGTDDLIYGENAILADAPEHVTDDYPRSFINASNVDVAFYESAMSLHNRLDRHGVENVLFYESADNGQLHHGYLTHIKNEEKARECLASIFEFLDKHNDER